MEDDIKSVTDDPRWNAFNTEGFACSCGQRHVGLFPIHMQIPKGWPGPIEYEPDEALRMDGNFLSYNLCVWDGKAFAMRMRMPLTIRGAMPHAFMYTVWGSLNRPDFEAYIDAKAKGTLNRNARAMVRLVNNVSGFTNTGGLMGSAFQQEDGGLPVLLTHGAQPDNDPKHPLISQQKNGIGVDRMLELFAAYKHEMRPGAA